MSTTRINLDFSPFTINVLSYILQHTDASSRTEVIRRSLTSYKRLVDARNAGDKVILRDEKTGSEVELVEG